MPSVDLFLDARAALGEGIVWDERDGVLWWVDIDAGLVHRTELSGADRTAAVGEKVGCLTLRERGGLIIGTASAIAEFDFDSATVSPIVEPEADLPENRFNDSVVDPRGRWWVGSMHMGKPQRPDGAFWRFDPDHSAHRRMDGIHVTNGLAFAPDGRTMYFADSNDAVRTIFAADYDPDTGEPGPARMFFDTRNVPGRPDGAAVDADGCYWMAGVGGWQLIRLTAVGAIDMVIDLPVERPSKPVFGGPALDTLFVTSIGTDTTPGTDQPHAGSLYAVTGLPTKGLIQPRFAG